MKKLLLVLALGVLGSATSFACEFCDGSGMKPENRKMMAELHSKVAECLNKDPKEASIEDCHKIMKDAMAENGVKGDGMSCHHEEMHEKKSKSKKAK